MRFPSSVSVLIASLALVSTITAAPVPDGGNKRSAGQLDARGSEYAQLASIVARDNNPFGDRLDAIRAERKAAGLSARDEEELTLSARGVGTGGHRKPPTRAEAKAAHKAKLEAEAAKKEEKRATVLARDDEESELLTRGLRSKFADWRAARTQKKADKAQAKADKAAEKAAKHHGGEPAALEARDDEDSELLTRGLRDRLAKSKAKKAAKKAKKAAAKARKAADKAKKAAEKAAKKAKDLEEKAEKAEGKAKGKTEEKAEEKETSD